MNFLFIHGRNANFSFIYSICLVWVIVRLWNFSSEGEMLSGFGEDLQIEKSFRLSLHGYHNLLIHSSVLKGWKKLNDQNLTENVFENEIKSNSKSRN